MGFHFFCSLINFAKARTFLLVVHFLPSGHFFGSTSPTAFFRPNRNLRTSARAGAVKVGRRSDLSTTSGASRPHLDGSEHGGRLEAIGLKDTPVLLCASGGSLMFAHQRRRSVLFNRSRITIAPPGSWFSSRSSELAASWSSWASAPKGSTRDRLGSKRNRAVAETRPGRDDVSRR